MKLMEMAKPSTGDRHSPWDQLPLPEPRNSRFYTRHFYHVTAKHLVKDFVRIMMNGIAIDMKTVDELGEVIQTILYDVDATLKGNRYIKDYLAHKYSSNKAAYIKDKRSKLVTPESLRVPFNHKDMLHRSCFMTIFAERYNISNPNELLTEGVYKWSVRLVKKLGTDRPVLLRMLSGTLPVTHPILVEAEVLASKVKAKIRNKARIALIENPKVERLKLNPNSSKQKAELFEFIGVPCESQTKTGAPSWNRDELVRVNSVTTDDSIKEFTQALIDHSYAAIIHSTFIPAFMRYSIDGRLHGNYKLLGAKTARPTSSNPNMLNAPSTKSIFAYPVKRCFKAEKGRIVGAIDFASLEDRVLASLSRDPGKCGIVLNGWDGHSYNALGYGYEELEELEELFNSADDPSLGTHYKNTVDGVDLFSRGSGKQQINVEEFKLGVVGSVKSRFKSLRQDSKDKTFKLAYGGFPDVHKGGRITQEIFDKYHEQLYPKVTEFREEYVLPTAKAEGQIHLGLGFTLKTDSPDSDVRTLNNGCSQFWSILTLLAINKLHQFIDDNGLQDDILVTATIYDAIYFDLEEDSKIISMLNKEITRIMEKDFMLGQIAKNEADLEIGTSWADLVELPRDATEEFISDTIEELHVKAVEEGYE